MRSSQFRTLASLTALCSLLAPAARASSEVLVPTSRGNVSVFVPDSYSAATPTPLVLLLHGYASSGQAVEDDFQFLPLVDTHGFIYAHPDGTTDSAGFQFWNGTDACCDYFNSGASDALYLSDLINTIENTLSIDPKRISIAGYSNGGFMAYRMACDSPDKIASIASLGGATWFEPAACNPAESVHVLEIHGTADTHVVYSGGNLQGVVYPGAVESVDQWAGFDLCQPSAVAVPKTYDLDSLLPGNETTVTVHLQCDAGGSGELWTVNGGTHFLAYSASFGQTVIEHLLAHPKNDPPVAYCTAGVSSGNCQAMIAASGVPSTTAVSGFFLQATGVEGGKDGLFFFGANGRQASTWGSGTSYQCVLPPVKRGGLLIGTGMTGACDGALTQDLNARWTAKPLQNPGAGAVVQAQLWYRDPFNTSNQTTGLSNAIEFVVGP